jgi:hypothetical protein
LDLIDDDPPSTGHEILEWRSSHELALAWTSEVLSAAAVLLVPAVIALYCNLGSSSAWHSRCPPLTVFSLLGMARWVHKRGGFCTKASTVLRSLYPIILGLGGWLLGTLIVLATLPSVPIDDELLVALRSACPPASGSTWPGCTGTGQHRTNTEQRCRIGGRSRWRAAWLGFLATADLTALATAILGAVAAGNLALILLDMARPAPPMAGFPPTPFRTRRRRPPSRRHPPALSCPDSTHDDSSLGPTNAGDQRRRRP